MATKKKTNKTAVNVRLVVVVVVGLLAAVAILFANAANNAIFNAEDGQTVSRSSSQPIKNTKDLDTAKDDLDKTNIDSLDQGLNQLNQETSTLGP